MVICLTMLPPEPRIWYGMYLIIYGNTVRIITIVAAVSSYGIIVATPK